MIVDVLFILFKLLLELELELVLFFKIFDIVLVSFLSVGCWRRMLVGIIVLRLVLSLFFNLNDVSEFKLNLLSGWFILIEVILVFKIWVICLVR